MFFVIKKKHIILVALCCVLIVMGVVSFQFYQRALPTASTNWGLSFQEEGKLPVGNATPEYLRQYNAFYTGDTEKKVIYLTFDAGFENGNTPAILDALKKHNAKAA